MELAFHPYIIRSVIYSAYLFVNEWHQISVSGVKIYFMLGKIWFIKLVFPGIHIKMMSSERILCSDFSIG